MLSKALKSVFVISVFYFLLFFALGNVGLLGPDEPRYASIGRQMSHTGDWVTPRLWGEPWFEKPALLYWMTGLGFSAGLGDELAPRLPVALMSAAFLAFFYFALKREFGKRPALFATAILGSSAAWLGYTAIAVTDLPMSAAFAASMLLWMRWARGSRTAPYAAALLGLAVLAKGLVPMVLALPVLWLVKLRRPGIRDSALALAAFAIVAAPWYILCTLRNGPAFLVDFFWKHHFERFATNALQHQQPFWYYVPILLAGLFPWTPLLLLLFRRKLYTDERRQFLLIWLVFGLAFFSAATNKLPGYLLPLFPALAALLGVALAERINVRWHLAATALLLALVPVAAAILPETLASGLSHANLNGALPWFAPIGGLILAAAVWLLESSKRRVAAIGLAVAGITAGVLYIKLDTYPKLDRIVSARELWQRVASEQARTCVQDLPRSLRYGLNYYSTTPLPDCADESRPIRITSEGEKWSISGQPISLVPATPTPPGAPRPYPGD